MKSLFSLFGILAIVSFGTTPPARADDTAAAPQLYLNSSTGEMATMNPDGQLVPVDPAALHITVVANEESPEARGGGHGGGGHGGGGHGGGFGGGHGGGHGGGWGHGGRGWGHGGGWGGGWGPVYPCDFPFSYPYCYY